MDGALLLLLTALWIAGRPYYGIIHDARLYVVQAINASRPGLLSDDLYFRYGSQDSFTLFSRLYAPLVDHLGPAHAHLVATIAGQAIWFVAALFLAKTVFRSWRVALLAVAGIIALPPRYGPNEIFGYGEPFATPRLFAEAIVLVALGLAWRRHFVLCAIAFGLAATLHPLMALSGGSVVLLLVMMRKPGLWVAAALAAAAVLICAALGLEPFARLLARFDDQWLSIVLKRCSFAFLRGWQQRDAAYAISSVAVLVAVTARRPKAERRAIYAVLGASAGALLCTYVGADLAHDVLVVNLQVWRTLWIVSLLGNAYLLVATSDLPLRSGTRILIYAALAGGMTSRFVFVPWGLEVALYIAAAAAIFVHSKNPRADAVVNVFALIGSASMVAWFSFVLWIAFHREDGLDIAEKILIPGAIAAAFIFATIDINPRRALLLGLLGLVIAIAAYDRRGEWERYVEESNADGSLVAFVGGSRNVYWEDGVELLWLKLERPQYYSCLQGTGAMFYAQTAFEYERRTQALKILDTFDYSTRPHDLCEPRAFPGSPRRTSATDLKAACAALPDLNSIVLLRPVPGAASVSWVSPRPLTITDERNRTKKIVSFYRYDCQAFRPAI